MNAHQQTAHIFRHEYGLLVASLLRRVGVEQLDAVEDAVQQAMLKALDVWTRQAIPDNPSGWLYQVAYREFLTNVRNAKRRQQLLAEQWQLEQPTLQPDEVPPVDVMTDDFLQVLFVACHESIPIASQLVFTLKSLCGFSVREVALRLFITEANVYKRFNRAKQQLQKQPQLLDELSELDKQSRLPMVQRVIYLMFTEGYLSSHEDHAIRTDLCEEALRLIRLLVETPSGNVPESHALLALMYFNVARLQARRDESGALLLLDQQDRSQWDPAFIELGITSLHQSASGETLSRYHLEACIAAEHCLAPSLAVTNWQKIVKAYELLEAVAPSPIHILNRAVAMAEWQGAEAGLAIIKCADIPSWLARSYHWYAVNADLQRRCGLLEEAQQSADQAIRSAPSEHIRQLLRVRLQMDFTGTGPPVKLTTTQ
ncbi:RNA polymerase sigma factor [Leucothrix arctica]|uniref:RNA polymerase subunit sigma-70 n=1 Tax=Leucothrix arctica TaxID=1481894 RepID=A0A317C4I5_9GAMM|nr:sigma-70 family RNA polymerase sigma factor [Leucothrix arctica]PWQ93111.1 RNA polymerase subunit sigma-70 [Leucothrix arctica]